jgi:hypothetical protein
LTAARHSSADNKKAEIEDAPFVTSTWPDLSIAQFSRSSVCEFERTEMMKYVQLFLAATMVVGKAQQPFLTDDADTAPAHHFHLEILTELDRLQSSAYPALHQNTTRVQLTYGLLEQLEIGFDGPLLAIYNARNSGAANAFGFGDLDLQMKYKLCREHNGSRWPAITFGLYIEMPTGKTENQLGSGIADYWLNGILQKKLTSRLTYRLNSGILFSGNTLTGAIGIRSTRGRVFTGASSLTYQLNGKWLLGGELVGAFTPKFELGKAQLQSLFGGKYAISKTVSLDFGVTGGKFEGSPRLGGAFGISLNF